MKYFVIFLVLIGFTGIVATNPAFALCAYDSSNPHVPCDDTREFLVLDSSQMQIENINGTRYYVSESFELNSQLYGMVVLNDVSFTLPYTSDPPRHIYSDVVFSDGTNETLSIIFDEPDFTMHVEPQAGLVGRSDGYHFLISVTLKEISPLKQIKNGVALVDVQCKDEKVPAIRYDKMRVACVSLDTESKLVMRGWATMRLAMPGDNISEALCNNYKGKWHPEYNGCRGISDLQCSLIGGKFVNNLKICEDGICPDKKYAVCVIEPKKLDWKMINSEFPITPLVFQVSKDEKIFDVEYGINGGMIKNMTFSNHTNSILITIDSADEGNLVLGMPRNLLDAKMDYCPPHLDNPPDDRFFVLLDGEEIWYDEILTTNEIRVLQIKFAVSSTKLEIIGACLI